MSNKPRHTILWAAAVAVLVSVIAVAVVVLSPRLRGRVADIVRGGEGVSTLDVKPCRSEFPIKGIDLSHHNGDIDFERVAGDSVDFVILKATEGADYTDSCLVRNYQRATRAGLLTGFYHFFRFDRGGVRQGRHFMSVVDTLGTEMPLVIDFERAGNPGDVDYYLVVGRLRDMAAYLQRHGRRVMVYCNHNDYDRYIRGNFDDLDLWLASGRLPEDDDRRHLWQHSHNGRVAGISTPVDINTFNGSRDEFFEWINRPQPVPVRHSLPADSAGYGHWPQTADSVSGDSMAQEYGDRKAFRR